MKYFLLILFTFLFSLGNLEKSYSQGLAISTDTGPPRQGCRRIDVYCQCIYPIKNFVVRNQKLGKSNLGEPGECVRNQQIQAGASEMPVTYCLNHDAMKNIRGGESRCQAQWVCTLPCLLNQGP